MARINGRIRIRTPWGERCIDVEHIAVTFDGVVDWVAGSVELELWPEYANMEKDKPFYSGNLKQLIDLISDPDKR